MYKIHDDQVLRGPGVSVKTESVEECTSNLMYGTLKNGKLFNTADIEDMLNTAYAAGYDAHVAECQKALTQRFK